MLLEDYPRQHGLGAIKTYEKCISILVELLANAGVEFKPSGVGQIARFESVRREIERQLETAKGRDDLWKAAAEFGIETPPDGSASQEAILIEEVENVSRSGKAVIFDDLSPSEFKEAIYEVVDRYGNQTSVIGGRKLLREALNVVQKQGRTLRRINVVSSNFPRMATYLDEVIEVDGRIRRHGRGKNLDTLKIKIG